tara:strand:- start:5637 stop:5795 length:159 start_codon:yes stop_codon:yes gene_type:complete
MMALIAVFISALFAAVILLCYIERLVKKIYGHSKENKRLLDNIKKMKENDNI